MRKLVVLLLSLAAWASAAGQGIAAEKVDVAKLKEMISKSDAEIADPKKASKAATWLKRGDTFYEVDGKPVNSLYPDMPELMLFGAFGKAQPTEQTVGGTTYKVYEYEHFTAYMNGDAVSFYAPKTVVDPTALDKAMAAYEKAYELDKKSERKVAGGLENVRRKSVEDGGTAYTLGEYKKASDSFRRAYKASTHPSMAAVDTLSLYYAGMMGVYSQDWEPALADIEKAMAMGFDMNGGAYLMKFHALYGQERKEEALAALQQGMQRYPGNEDLIDMTMRYYAENDGDPSSMIPVVEKAIAENPDNVSLRQGLARVYDKLGRNDEAIAAIEKAVELAPNDFLSHYLHGLFIIKKGDALDNELREMTVTSRAQYNAALKNVIDTFALALAPLQRAHELQPNEAATVELLKNLTFRLREDPAMNDLYEKYDKMLQEM